MIQPLVVIMERIGIKICTLERLFAHLGWPDPTTQRTLDNFRSYKLFFLLALHAVVIYVGSKSPSVESGIFLASIEAHHAIL